MAQLEELGLSQGRGPEFDSRGNTTGWAFTASFSHKARMTTLQLLHPLSDGFGTLWSIHSRLELPR